MNFSEVQPEEITLEPQETPTEPLVFQDVEPVGLEDSIQEAEEARSAVQQEPEEPVEEDLRGPEGPPGRDGHTPTDEELLELITPLIPEPIPGETPTEEEILSLVKPLIPRPKDGKTPTKEELVALIKPLIPKPIKGKDGSDGQDGKDGGSDTPEQIKEKLTELEVKDRWFDWGHLKNIPGEIFRKDADGLISWGGTTLRVNGTAADSQTILDLTQGTGITITDSGSGVITFATTITQYTDEMAQDAVGAMVDTSLVYVDGTPLLTRAALTGDVTASQGSNTLTLATVNANVGSFGSASQVATFTVNAKGLITAASNTSISLTSSAISDFTEAAQDAVGNSVGNGLDYDDTTGAISVDETELTHNSLSGLTTGDPHTQYLLRQPTADVVINDSGGDFNFVIKGDTDANLFVLDAGTDRIGIGDSSPDNKLDVDHTTTDATAALGISRTDNRSSTTSNIPTAILASYTDSSTANRLSAQTLRFTFTKTAGSTGAPTAFDTLIDVGATVNEDAVYIMRGMTIEGPTVASGKTLGTWQGIMINEPGGAGSVTTFNAITTLGGSVIFNENGGNYDFRVEGDTNANALLVDASGNNVKIAGSAVRATTEGTNHLDIFDGTAPVGTLANGISLFSASGKLKSADAAGTVGHVLSVSAVNNVSPTAQNRTLTVDIGGTTYYITAKTTND